jgi:hypothetical protein
MQNIPDNHKRFKILNEQTRQPEARFTTAYLELAIRIVISLVICALTAFALMRFAGGAGMFCIDPPAADPGWEWKVPLAWSTIYGISVFVGVAVAVFRVKSMKTAIIVAAVTIGAFILLRFISVSPTRLYFAQTEAIAGIPAMLVAGFLACVIASLTKKDLL